jgi:hypothetical protein
MGHYAGRYNAAIACGGHVEETRAACIGMLYALACTINVRIIVWSGRDSERG